MSHPQLTRQRLRRAYTLVEMMIVIVILIVVMALVVPVIGNARNAAKQTITRQLLNNLSQASQQFELDNRRLPGYFDEASMGSPDNASRGFPSMANIMLDLAGGTIDTANPPPDAIMVGPLNNAQGQVHVRVGLIGAPTQTKGVVNKGYFTPDAKNFVLQNAIGAKATSVMEHIELPDLVDAFGQPILAWRQDIAPSPGASFAAVNSTTRASFYWNANAAFLNARALGQKKQDQTNSQQGANGSLIAIGGAAFAEADVLYSLQGLLGNPAFPASTTDAGGHQVPAASRGKLIFQSAGTDGSYLGARDRGGIIAQGPAAPPTHFSNIVDYYPGRDPLDNFDDLVSVAGN